MQADWDEATSASIRSAPAGIKAVEIQHLLTQLWLGGSNWMRQFIYGFGATGHFSQDGVFPPSDHTPKHCPPERAFGGAADRFGARAKSSGWAHIDALWSGAMDQVSKGWLSAPERIHPAKGAPTMGGHRVNAEFRFAAVQMDKIRACDDLKYGCVNVACATRTAITLPTWGRIGQICIDVADTNRAWSFFKLDHKAAYKNLPLNPDQADACIVTLRNSGADSGTDSVRIPYYSER